MKDYKSTEGKTYLYPDRLVPRLKDAWRRSRQTPKEILPDFPPVDVVQRLLDTCYHASFMTEESREVIFHVVLCGRVEMERDCDESWRRYSRISPVIFSSPRVFNETELLRLSPATDPNRVFIGVEIDESLEQAPEKSLVIWGIIDAGSSWWDFVHGESKYGYPPPDFLTISVYEPGHLVVSRKGNVLLKLYRGESSEPSGCIINRGPARKFFDGAINALYGDVCDKLEVTRKEYPGHDYPERMYLQYFQRVIFNIRRKMHGGTLIVIPNSFDAQDLRLQDRLLFKYNCSDQRAWQLLVDSITMQTRYLDRHFGVINSQRLISPEEYQEVTELASASDDINNALADSVKFCASLSSVDGAVVMTDHLKVLGFGCEVIVPMPGLNYVKVSRDPEGIEGRYIPMESFGTRHRAAFRFCSSFENVLVFVVSQDGIVRLIKRIGHDIVLWSDINLGHFGV